MNVNRLSRKARVAIIEKNAFAAFGQSILSKAVASCDNGE